MEDPDVRPRSDRGLVLAGGGAKGAYQFGCLLALRDANIAFDAVSGTSVGALNAFLWATDQLDRGREIWEHLSQDRIYPWRMPKIFAPLLILPALFFHYFRACNLGLPHLPLPARIMGAAVTTSPLLCLVPLAYLRMSGSLHYPLWGSLLISGLLVSLWALMFVWAAGQNVGKRRLFSMIAAQFFAFLVMSGAFSIGQHFGQLEISLTDVYQITAILSIPVILYWVSGTFPLYFLKRGPLRQTIEQLVDGSVLIPTYVCAAKQHAIFDPDDPHYARPNYQYNTMILESVEWTVLKDSIWIPQYFQIEELSRGNRIAALLASAALPFGVVPPVIIGGGRYVDGGVADNVPIQPFIESRPCEEIVIIDFDGDESPCSVQHWMDIDRLQRLCDFKYPDSFPWNQKPEYQVTNNPPSVVPRRSPPFWPRLIRIHPKESYGFLRGTMNFSTRFARKLLKVGYEDAVRTIWETGLAAKAASAT